ncbi:MAG: 3-hydroxybutyryl-CoA dehydratase [Mariniblastus sp.]|jgi:3-hydroxybutyryl-CoA dehydratase
MESPLYFDDIQLGRTWVSPRRTVTEADVIQFATSTGDFNPLHVDYDFASNSHYRQPIAHGLLGLSWVAGLGSHAPNVNTLAFTAVRNWEFSRPIFFGDTVYVETVCLEKTAAGRRAGKILWQRKLLNQAAQVVQQGTFETLVAIESIVPRPHSEQQTDRANSTNGQRLNMAPDSDSIQSESSNKSP